ncbi:MAG TPA: flagellar biosynthesis protein FliQ [Symbiobacteriaceae bacterium]
MTPDYALSLGQEALKVALMVGLPVLGLGLAAGVLVALFQATTQINEASLQFLPKILAAALGLVIFGPWMLNIMVDYARHMIALIPEMVR